MMTNTMHIVFFNQSFLYDQRNDRRQSDKMTSLQSRVISFPTIKNSDVTEEMKNRNVHNYCIKSPVGGFLR